MLTIANALLPVFLLIGLGVALKRTRFLAEEFWPGIEKLNYWVLLPALFFHALATARLGSVAWPRVAAVSILAIAGTALLVRCAWPLFGGSGPAYTSVLQGAVRFNSFVGLAAMYQLFGAEGLTLATVIVAATVPLVNALCVLALARHGQLEGRAAPSLARSLLTNPLILGCAAGGLWNAIGLPLGTALDATFKAMGQAAVVSGLLVVGASLEFSEARAQAGPVLLSSLIKFGAMPLLTFGLSCGLGLDGVERQCLVFFEALPTATSSYILARQLGGDARLMSSIVTFQTVLALFALPAWLAFLRAAG